jgi:protein tyrosine/serine phosphatase
VDFGSLRSSPRLNFIALMIAALVAGFGAFFGLRFSSNVHVIETGLAYRSAYLWPDELAAVVEDYGIRSIITLSASGQEQDWYRGIQEVTSAKRVALYVMPLSERTVLTSDQLRELVTLLRVAPKPVLINSRHGADRCGLAAAIFKYAIASRPVEEAGRQLSIRYGHFPYFWSGTDAMDASFRRFLAEQHASTKVP